MMHSESLRRFLMRRAMLGSVIALLVMLVVALVLADRLALQASAGSMLNELRNSDTPWIGQGRQQGVHRGRRVFTADGKPVDPIQGRGWGWGRMERGQERPWPTAREVARRGDLTGVGSLPWLPEPVAWAAVSLEGPQGQPWVIVSWNRASAIRASVKYVYVLIGLSVLVTYLLAMAFLNQSLHAVATALRTVTDAGRAMVQGDFSARVPAQNTRELAELGQVVNELAQHLDEVIRELQTDARRLQQLESLQRQFVADASHELRAPLSSMAMTLDAWRDGLLTDSEREEAVLHLRREVTRLSSMVSQLLDLSRIESGRYPLRIEAVAVDEVIDSVVNAYAHQPGAPIQIHTDPSKRCALADRDALYRVLRNLLDNARRFTPDTGRITVTAEADADRIHICVTDTGLGMSPEDVERVWERFARSERERASASEGVGLGLAIVRGLVEAMHSSVGLESQVDNGTSVSFWLPAAKCETDLTETRDT